MRKDFFQQIKSQIQDDICEFQRNGNLQFPHCKLVSDKQGLERHDKLALINNCHERFSIRLTSIWNPVKNWIRNFHPIILEAI